MRGSSNMVGVVYDKLSACPMNISNKSESCPMKYEISSIHTMRVHVSYDAVVRRTTPASIPYALRILNDTAHENRIFGQLTVVAL